jgi:hypothetical protein
VLLVSGDCEDAALTGEMTDGKVEATVTAWGATEKVVLE